MTRDPFGRATAESLSRTIAELGRRFRETGRLVPSEPAPDDGFYWVKEKGCDDPQWLVAQSKNGRVWVIGDDGWWPPDDFEWHERISPPSTTGS